MSLAAEPWFTVRLVLPTLGVGKAENTKLKSTQGSIKLSFLTMHIAPLPVAPRLDLDFRIADNILVADIFTPNRREEQ